MMIGRCNTAFISGDLPAAGALADQALDLALREGNPTILGLVDCLQVQTRFSRGDLAGAEKHFTAGLRFFDDPGFRQIPSAALATFGTASANAWMLGRANVARERDAQMTAAVNRNNPYDLAFSGYFAAYLQVCLRDYEQAEALAAAVLRLSEQHQFPLVAAGSRCLLGHARAQLGRATDGIALIRQAIAGVLEIGATGNISRFKACLAAARRFRTGLHDSQFAPIAGGAVQA